MVDLDYAKVVGRLAITVGDVATGPDVDLDDNPDVLWCDEGIVRFTPLVTEMHVVGDPTVGPFKAGNAEIDAVIDADTGRLTFNGQPFVMLLDLGSDKVNPKIPRTEGAYQVEYIGVKCRGLEVNFTPHNIHPRSDVAENDITLLAPVPTTGGESIVRGPQGVGVETMTVNGAGELVATLDDGTVVNAGALPVGPGGSDAGVAGYIDTEGSATRAALSTTFVPVAKATAVTGAPVLIRTIEAARGAVYREALSRGSSTFGGTTKENTTWGFGFNMEGNYTKELTAEPMIRLGLEGSWLRPDTGDTYSEFHVEYVDPAEADVIGIRPLSIDVKHGGDSGKGSPSLLLTVTESQPYSGIRVATPGGLSLLEFGSSGWNFYRNMQLARGASAASVLTVGDALNGAKLILNSDGAVDKDNAIELQREGVSSWLLYDAGGLTEFHVRDTVNGRMHMTFIRGADVNSAYTDFQSKARFYGDQIEVDGAALILGTLGTVNAWVDAAQGGGANRDLNFRSKGTGAIVSLTRHRFDGNVGFYGTTPIAKQTGVAVTAAGVHAALVNLGLISA